MADAFVLRWRAVHVWLTVEAFDHEVALDDPFKFFVDTLKRSINAIIQRAQPLVELILDPVHHHVLLHEHLESLINIYPVILQVCVEVVEALPDLLLEVLSTFLYPSV